MYLLCMYFCSIYCYSIGMVMEVENDYSLVFPRSRVMNLRVQSLRKRMVTHLILDWRRAPLLSCHSASSGSLMKYSTW